MLRQDDRLLVLAPGDPGQVVRWALSLAHGSLVVLAEGDALYEWRRALAALDNVMVSPGTPDAIPWQNGCFTVIVHRAGLPETAEMRRVLHPERGRLLAI